MDPEATYRELLASLTAGDREAAVEHARNLSRWLRRGGFPPRVELRLAGSPCLQTVLAQRLCQAVLDPSFPLFDSEVSDSEGE